MKVSLNKSGTSCNAGMPVDFVYDSSTHYPTHAAVKGGERRGLCGVQPSRDPSTCPWPDGGLCRHCATQVEQLGGHYYVKDSAVALHARPFTEERHDYGYDDD